MYSVRKIRETEGVGSVYRETKHFSTVTSVNGPKRIFYGKGFARFFWMSVVVLVFAFLLYQIAVLVRYYFSKPTLSQISFIANDGSMDFPAVTICNLNPVKTSYIHNLNTSGELSDEVLNYLLATKTNSIFMFNNADRNALKQAHESSQIYLSKHPDFSILNFLNAAQFDCAELFEVCYFGGKRFDCCDFMSQTITSLGRCWVMNFQNRSEIWMKKQVSPRISAKAGLQIIANAKHEEQFTSFHYSSFQENGFRYFIHPPTTSPDLASEGITVSPSRVVNTAIKAVLHDLLNRHNWGNCTHTWPSGYSTSLPYGSSVCQALCIAAHFQKLCGCAPFSYNIDNKLTTCLPYEEVSCMEDKMTKKENDTVVLDLPACSECHLACQKNSFTSYTSYGDGFNNSSMTWLINLTNNSESYVRENIAVISIHFLELFYTSYTQVKATSVSKTLSGIFGLNGLWFGMSVVSLTELFLFLIKISWIMVSRRRRHHLFEKKESEKRKVKNIEVAVKEVEESRINSSANLAALDSYSNPADEHQFWYKNTNNLSDLSLDSVVQLATEFDNVEQSGRISVKSRVKFEDEVEEEEEEEGEKNVSRF
ncbi:unnamed protein product [Caenorhabditis sp. 36 PRJEB53466]|nr:unnamed protein product [Caenorhabditis sp. 36 PRJEB53466]